MIFEARVAEYAPVEHRLSVALAACQPMRERADVLDHPLVESHSQRSSGRSNGGGSESVFPSSLKHGVRCDVRRLT